MISNNLRRHNIPRFAISGVCCLLFAAYPALAKHIELEPSGPGLYGRLPLAFEPNVGQTNAPASFLVRARNHTVFVGPDNLTFSLYSRENPAAPLTSQIVRVRFEGANQNASMQGGELLPGHSNYLIGQDPAQWHTNIPQYKRIIESEIYPGIGIELYSDAGKLEYDFRLAPGADASPIRLGIEGASQISLNEAGDLVLKVDGGELIQTKPKAFQDKRGVRSPVAANYRILADHSVVLELGAYDNSLPLTIDPAYSYSTQFGGSAADVPTAIAVDPSNFAYVTGGTASANFPTVTPLRSAPVASDAFVTKFNAAGTAILYSTYLGGNHDDAGQSIAADSTGAYVGGTTTSTDFPPVNALVTTPGPGFLTKLNAAGTALVYSTYFQGGNSLAINGSQEVFIQGGITAGKFFSKINSTGTSVGFEVASFGDGTNVIKGLTVHTQTGHIVVTGTTTSSTLPVTNAIQSTRNSGSTSTGFVTKFNSTGTTVLYSTYLGGSVNDQPMDVAVDTNGNAYVAGKSSSPNFPVTTETIEPLAENSSACFITELGTNGALLFSSFLGGQSGGVCNGVAVDGSGNVLLAGTAAFNHPLLGGLQSTDNSSQSAFVTKLTPDLSAIVYSIVVGTNTLGVGLAKDSSGNAYLAANPVPPGSYPIVNTTFFGSPGGGDAAVSKIADDTACAGVLVSPTTFTFNSAGGPGTVNVSAPDTCRWNAVGDSGAAPPITAANIQSPYPTFTGSGTVDFTVGNVGAGQPTAVGYLVVAGQRIKVTQNGTTPSPLLSIAKVHSGNFTQGQANATYTLTVSNAASHGSTSGTVTVNEVVPSGMTLVSMTGTGWTCPGTAANNCTRVDALAGGASYPAITVKVNVASNAGSSLTNQAIVSGGGSALAITNDPTIVNTSAGGGPTATSVTPSSGSGLSQTFSFLYADPSGATDITSVQMDINATLAVANACYLFYVRAPNALYLANNSGAWQGPVTVGSANTLQNSQCSVNAAASSVTPSGNNLTVNLALTFTAGFAGAKNVYMEVQNASHDSGWSAKGTWTVGSAPPPPDFSIGMTAGPGTVAAGASPSYTVTVGSLNGFSGVVNLGVSGLPSGVTGAFNPTTITGSGTSTLTLTTTGASPSSFTITVTGTSGALTHNTTASLTITGSGGSPTATSVTPGSGTGLSQTFSFLYTDPNGATDIQSVQMDINATLAVTNACYLFYVRGTNALYLASDAGAWQGPVSVGSANTLQNSQCSVSAGGSSVTPSGNTLTVNLALTFKAAFAGAKNVYMEVRNASVDSGWSAKGSWTVGSGAPSPDFTIGMTSGPGTVAAGASPTYTVTVTGANGFAGVVNLAVSGLPSGVTGAFVPTTITGSGSSTLTLTTTGASASSFTITVTGTSGALTHTTTASLTITGSGGGFPTPVSVTPSSGTGLTQTFAFLYTDPNGATDITSAQIDINATLAVANACYMLYSRAANQVYLASDAGAWQGPITLGGSGTLTNSQCTVSASGSSSTPSGNNLTVNLAMTFKAAFAGAKNVYMEVQNASHDSGWTQEGTWTVGSGGQTNSPPTVVSVTPSSGSGTSHTFAFAYADPNGATDITSVQMDINSTLSVSNGCYLYWVRATNALYLANDSGAFQGPIAIGSAGTLQNSQCTVNSGTSSVTAVGNNLTVNLALTFKAPFTGVKNVYAEVRDGTHDAGWSQVGTWTP